MAKDIKEILMKEIEDLNSGKSEIKKAKAITKLAAQVIYRQRIEQEKETLNQKVRMWNKIGGNSNA